MKGALFLLLDVVPDYVEKTFGFRAEDKLMNSFLFGAPIVYTGDNIPEGLNQALIIYNASAYHWEKYKHLEDQIKAINPGVIVVGLPVAG